MDITDEAARAAMKIVNDIEDDVKGALVELISAKELADLAVERVIVHGGDEGLDETWRKEAWRIADNAIAAAVRAIRNA